jgi:hypothetical protein
MWGRLSYYLFRIMATIVLLGAVTFIVISATGVYYADHDLVRLDSRIHMPILFKIGLALSIYLGIAVFPFLGKPRQLRHHFSTLPLFIVLSCLYLVVSSPSEIDHQLSTWQRQWEDSLEIRQFQSFHRCCGWSSAQDRGLANCPMDYRSGCIAVVEEYVRPRFTELFTVTMIVLVLVVVAWAGCVVSFCIAGSPSEWFAMFDEVPDTSSSSWD